MTRYYRLNDGGVVWPERKYIACGMERKGGKQVVVIDPEDREQVARLQRLWWRMWGNEGAMTNADGTVGGHYIDKAQAALREFANPTPPRPEEPMTFGAIVEDRDGRHWVRVAPAMDALPCPWCSGKDECEWSDIDAVRVLSEGVQS